MTAFAAHRPVAATHIGWRVAPPTSWGQRRMFERLAGKTVVLTREPADNAELASRLRGRCARIIEFSCVRTEPLTDTSGLAAELVAYRTVADGRGDVAAMQALLASREPVAILFHSPSAVAGMLAVIEAPLTVRAVIHVFGRSTLRAVRDALGTAADVSLIQEEAAHVAHR